MKMKMKKIINNIKRIIKWTPVIWKDRDWDYVYLYQIIYKKLDTMEDFFRSDKTMTMDSLNTAEEIREAKKILKRMIEEYSYYEGYENDKERFFELLNKNIQKWWD
jgi:hypothetical protein